MSLDSVPSTAGVILDPAVNDDKKSITRSAYLFCCEINPAVIDKLDDIIAYFKKFNPNYILVGSHIGSSQGLHYHLFAQYPVKKHLTFGKKTTFGAHGEACFGSAQQNVAYIRCQDKKHIEEGVTYGGDYLEEGEMRLNGHFYSMRAREVAEMSTEDMLDLNPIQFNIAAKVKREVQRMEANEAFFAEMSALKEAGPTFHTGKCVHYYTGPSDSGKTVKAKLDAMEKYDVRDIASVSFDKSGFAHVLGNDTAPKCIVIEEYRDSAMELNKFLEMCDKWATTINVKGSELSTAAVKDIFLCSVKPLHKLYKKATGDRHEDRHQIYKRVQDYKYITSEHEVHSVTAGDYAYDHFDWAKGDALDWCDDNFILN